MPRYVCKQDIEPEKFSGDPMKYHKFIRRFKMKIQTCDNEEECMTYLEQYTTGDAHRVVDGYSHMESGGLDAAMNELQRRYGQQPTIRMSYIDKIKNFPVFTVKEPKKLDELGTLLLEYLHATKQTSNTLDDHVEIRKIVSKLPIPSRNRWRSLVASVRARGDDVGFKNIVDFVNAEATSANDPIYGIDALTGSGDNHASSAGRNIRSNKQRSNAAVSNAKVSDRKVFKRFCKHCSGEHWLQDCDKFSRLSHDEKRNVIREKKVCFKCFRQGHFASDCKTPPKCEKCERGHHTVMHYNDAQATTNSNAASVSHEPAPSVSHECITNQCISLSSASTRSKASKLIIFPVTVYSNDLGRSKNVFAFIDSGSTCSYITDTLVQELQVTGEATTLHMGTMNGTRNVQCQIIEGVKVSKLDGKETRSLPPMYTIDRIPVDLENIPRRADFKKYKHMDVLTEYDEFEGEIGLMLGNDVPFVAKPIEISAGGEYEPFAMRTPLGWIPHGFSSISNVAITNLSIHKGEEAMLDVLQQVINSDFPEKQVEERKQNSQEDKQFLEIANKTVCSKEGKMQVNLPIKEATSLPDDKRMAEKRLSYLKRKLDKDSDYKQEYVDFMKKYIDKGYAEEVKQDEIKGNHSTTWYLPHHGVYHPTKKKLRVVFDCAAKHNV